MSLVTLGNKRVPVVFKKNENFWECFIGDVCIGVAYCKNRVWAASSKYNNYGEVGGFVSRDFVENYLVISALDVKNSKFVKVGNMSEKGVFMTDSMLSEFKVALKRSDIKFFEVYKKVLTLCVKFIVQIVKKT